MISSSSRTLLSRTIGATCSYLPFHINETRLRTNSDSDFVDVRIICHWCDRYYNYTVQMGLMSWAIGTA
jgi:hypothetical protein